MTPIHCPPLPADTARLAECSFGSFHPYLRIGKHLKDLLSGLDLSAVEISDKLLADSFHPYTAATILQYWENLTDQQAFHATRTRVDLKYALHLPLNFPGLLPIALCHFRLRLRRSAVARDLFTEMVERLAGLIKRDLEKTRIDVDQMLDAICTLSRTEEVIDAMNNAIEAVAASQPEWLKSVALAHWYERYYHKPTFMFVAYGSQELESLLQTIGEDSAYLLSAIDDSNFPALSRSPEIETLRQAWQWQYKSEAGKVMLRGPGCEHCSHNPAGGFYDG